VADRDHFESLWKLYPNKKGKESAWNSYKQSIRDGATDDEIKQGINSYLAEIKAKQTPKRYIKARPNMVSNRKGWQDEYDTNPEAPVADERLYNGKHYQNGPRITAQNNLLKRLNLLLVQKKFNGKLAKLKTIKGG
jgi:hypothetical protein